MHSISYSKASYRFPLRLSNSPFIIALIFWLFATVCAAPLQQISYGGQQAVKEYELKAVYLYNFIQFIQWPQSRPLSKDGSRVIGIVGESPFGDALEDLREDVRRSGMNAVRIVYYGSFQEDMNLSGCDLLFVSSSEKRNFSRIVESLRGVPVITVAETESFISSGGMIAMVRNKGAVRWIINRTPAEKAGLRLSVQLLNMALKVLE